MIAAFALHPMRATVRRRKLQRALANGEQQAIPAIAALLDSRFKGIKRDLRRANLRKRLAKAQHDGDLSKGISLNWPDWITDFVSGVKDALSGIVGGVQDVEADYWLTRGGAFDKIDPQRVIAAYEAREGRQIADIGEQTKQDVLNAISNWYNDPEQTFPDLLGTLGQWFGPARAERIARYESASISSQVTRDAMEQFGITKWNSDLASDPGPCPTGICVDMADSSPHDISEDGPPYHGGCKCGMTYASDDDTEIED